MIDPKRKDAIMAQDRYPEGQDSLGTLMKDYDALPDRDWFYANPAADDVEARKRALSGKRGKFNDYDYYDDPDEAAAYYSGDVDADYAELGTVNDLTVQADAYAVDPDEVEGDFYVDPSPEQERELGDDVTIYRTTGDGEAEVEETAENYDPAEHTVTDVKAYVEQHPDKKDEILAKEEDGKARTTLVGD
jgi:hypothetical protein